MFRPAVVLLPVLTLLVGCDSDKSKNPLHPGLSGPIDGVEIEAPLAVAPAPNASIRHDAVPLTLTVENAATNGNRPLVYKFELATDAAMEHVVFAQADVAPGDGQTSVQVPGPLTPGQTYHWRAQAGDGANTGPHSQASQFQVYEPVSLQAPRPISPTGGGTLGTAEPSLRTANAARTGPPEHTWYDFEVSLNAGFAGLVAARTVDEQPDQTAATVGPLQAGSLHFWRVRARSNSATSPWSDGQSFRTPFEVIAPPPPGNPGIPPGHLPVSNPGPRPRPAEGQAMVEAVIADLHRRGISMSGDCGGFEITRRVAWAFANRGAGLERKPGGRNCQGHSIDIILFRDGESVDMLIGSGVDNGPTWQEHGVLPDWPDWWIAPSNPD
jgi:hypothetical protein